MQFNVGNYKTKNGAQATVAAMRRKKVEGYLPEWELIGVISCKKRQVLSIQKWTIDGVNKITENSRNGYDLAPPPEVDDDA